MMKMSHLMENYILQHMQEEDPMLTRLYRETNIRLVNGRMCSGHLQGSILTLLSLLIKPSKILEIGTYTGYSAICLAKGLPKDGKLHTIEINDELEPFAATYIEESGYRDQIITHIGDASDIIPTLEDSFDLVFLDADKRLYLSHYQLIFPKVKIGGLIIADNTLWGGKVVEKFSTNDEQTISICNFNDFVHTDPRVETTILPVRDGMTLLRKISG